jgi:hypothetical protein
MQPWLAIGIALALLAAPAGAEYAFFDDVTDTIDVSGQTVIGSASTYEAVVMFPSGTGAEGRIFNEWTNFLEDKFLYAGPDLVGGYNFASPCCPEASGLALAPDVFHHVAYVLDGAAGEERFYLDGQLVGSRATASFDVGDGDGPARIGAIFRDGSVAPSFIGVLDSVRLSDVARYAGTSFSPATGDLNTDANTLLLYNFDDAPGSTTVVDGSPLGRNGTIGEGLAFAGATEPELGTTPTGPPSSLDSFLCYKAGSTKGGDGFEAPPDLTLVDAFETRETDVLGPKALCNPANLAGEGVGDAATHLESYAIKSDEKHEKVVGFRVDNRFGELSLDTIKEDRLLVPSAKGLAEPPGPLGATLVDHFKCYKAKVTKGTPKLPKGTQIAVADQFGEAARTLDVKKPKHLCLPVDKNGEGIQSPDSLLVCYQAKPSKGEPKHVKRSGVLLDNQFGTEQLDTVKEEELCVPSSRVGGGE